MDKRTLLAVALSMVILLGYQFFFSPSKVEVKDNSSVKSDNTAVSTPAVSKEQAKSSVSNTINTVVVNKDSLYSAKNELIELTFNKNSGNIYKASVLKYADKSFDNISFKSSSSSDYLAVKSGLNESYKSEIKTVGDKTIVSFISDSGGIVVTKNYEIAKGSYIVKFSYDVSNTTSNTINIPLEFVVGTGLGDGFEKSSYIFEGPLFYDGRDLKSKDAAKVKDTISGDNPKWFGYTSKYFLFSVVNGDFQKGSIEKVGDSAVVKGSKSFVLNPNSKQKIETLIFVGPKEYELLKNYNVNLEKSIDFGWFAFLAIPMLKFMLLLFTFVNNYGLAIIILTIIIKLVTYPLTIKSMMSMKKMQVLHPKIMEIREKFKGDQQKINIAMMDLYKKHGVNPMGGCMPMLIQIPIFFALYKALLVSIELKGSPFFAWITDLSMKDPYYITPILMGITMFLQQKMTPSTADPIQQKVFLFMPIIFTFLFLNFPSGLVIYWLTNNVLSIIQQYFINKKTV